MVRHVEWICSERSETIRCRRMRIWPSAAYNVVSYRPEERASQSHLLHNSNSGRGEASRGHHYTCCDITSLLDLSNYTKDISTIRRKHPLQIITPWETQIRKCSRTWCREATVRAPQPYYTPQSLIQDHSRQRRAGQTAQEVHETRQGVSDVMSLPQTTYSYHVRTTLEPSSVTNSSPYHKYLRIRSLHE